MNQEGSLVPVEFVTPSPTFWNIFFPPHPAYEFTNQKSGSDFGAAFSFWSLLY